MTAGDGIEIVAEISSGKSNAYLKAKLRVSGNYRSSSLQVMELDVRLAGTLPETADDQTTNLD